MQHSDEREDPGRVSKQTDLSHVEGGEASLLLVLLLLGKRAGSDALRVRNLRTIVPACRVDCLVLFLPCEQVLTGRTRAWGTGSSQLQLIILAFLPILEAESWNSKPWCGTQGFGWAFECINKNGSKYKTTLGVGSRK